MAGHDESDKPLWDRVQATASALLSLAEAAVTPYHERPPRARALAQRNACSLQERLDRDRVRLPHTMRACIQRVSQAQVTVESEIVGRIGPGLVVLLGVAAGDAQTDVEYLADKTVGLRIFEDAAGKMNRSLLDVQGELLAVSQFTLLADCRKGRRPSFTAAAAGPVAEELYQRFVEIVRALGVRVATGRFAAHMQVSLVNDGPVTILLDSRSGETGG